MKYSALIMVKNDDKEANVHMEFGEDDIYDVMQAFDTILNHATADEVKVFARRWIK